MRNLTVMEENHSGRLNLFTLSHGLRFRYALNTPWHINSLFLGPTRGLLLTSSTLFSTPRSWLSSPCPHTQLKTRLRRHLDILYCHWRLPDNLSPQLWNHMHLYLFLPLPSSYEGRFYLLFTGLSFHTGAESPLSAPPRLHSYIPCFLLLRHKTLFLFTGITQHTEILFPLVLK